MAEGTITACETMEELDHNLELAGPRLVCLYFTAPWCGPCKITGKNLKEIASEEKDVIFLKIDTAELEEATLKFEVEVMPTFLFIRNKEKVEEYIGGKLDHFRETIDRLKNPRPQPDS